VGGGGQEHAAVSPARNPPLPQVSPEFSHHLSRLDPVQLRSQFGLLRLHQRSLLADLPRGGIELALCIVSLFSGFVHVLA
jgi:hypothetical protein